MRSLLAGLVPALAAIPTWGQEPGALSQELHPSWSPSGTRLVFETDRYGSADIVVLDLESSQARRLTTSPAEDARPVWSPDGKWIAFHSNREGNHDLYVVRPDGEGLRRLTSDPIDETNCAWSPSSSELVYEARIQDRAGLAGIDGQPAWSPAGDRIAITSGRAGSLDIVLISPTGEELGNLTASWRSEVAPAKKS